MVILFDDPLVLAEYLVFPEIEARPSSSVLAPCCGRKTSADTVVDVRAVLNTVVRAGGYREATDHDWLCDGCRTRLIRDRANGWTPSRFARATGEPWEVVKDLRAREMVTTRLKLAPGNPDDLFHEIMATLPDTDIPNTEHPGLSNEERKR